MTLQFFMTVHFSNLGTALALALVIKNCNVMFIIISNGKSNASNSEHYKL